MKQKELVKARLRVKPGVQGSDTTKWKKGRQLVTKTFYEKININKVTENNGFAAFVSCLIMVTKIPV